MQKFVVPSNTHNVELITSFNNDFDNIVLCIHGFNGNRWGDAYDGLKDKFPNSMVCSYDMAGHGNSEIQSIDMRLNVFVQELKDVVDYLKRNFPNKPISLVAVSYGAYVTLAYLSKFNPSINKVVLVNPAFKMLEILQILKDFDYTKLKPNSKVVMKASKNKYMPKAFLDDVFECDLFKINKLNYDISIVVGTQDTLIPIQHTTDFADKFGIKITYIEDEHCIQNSVNWDKVAYIINK